MMNLVNGMTDSFKEFRRDFKDRDDVRCHLDDRHDDVRDGIIRLFRFINPAGIPEQRKQANFETGYSFPFLKSRRDFTACS